MKLRFDFNRQVQLFEHPLKVITTSELSEVTAKLAEVEQAVDSGLYAAGYLSYEAAAAFQSYYQTPPQGDMPLLWFGLYQQPLTDDSSDIPEELFENILSEWQPATSTEAYRQAILRIKSEIEAGNTYQTNYTIRLEAEVTECSEQGYYRLYQQLLSAQQAEYAACLDIGRFKILSASPELFFHWRQGTLTAKPMKGTAKRGLDAQDDLMRQEQLRTSEKDRAENVMIVDLLRNDISQVAIAGSVKVPALFDIEQYPTVWQMTSTISAQTRQQTSLTDIFRALFPCGSITGAPKASTMRLISQLEPQPREVYCGAIGYITPDKEALFSVPIRTVIIDTEKSIARYGVGGGITWDSTAENEYQEVINKAEVLRGVTLPKQLLESLLLKDGDYHLLTLHLKRLSASARYFNFVLDADKLTEQLQQLATGYQQGEYKVRLLLEQNGEATLSCDPITPLTQPLIANWAPFAVHSDNNLLYHKTTLRDHYPAATLDNEFLLYNQRDEITEFVNGNVVLLIDGQWLTPAISCGLLPGTERQALLQAGAIREAILTKAQFQQAQKIGFINSVRGWREVVWRDDLS
ncbi:aminodeoxychorismate synthase component I [Limnobaculum zhutongyuii]|uniref:Aminodeoxychorismate synthase component I n=1 Tax=Limnobaculum zhutongyuii TaxID=2498113 RepID=A0A411WIA9_9GAMM|nr:aminodeoxychorismate synthase component I [Limnobaculum zhutongyuii]QBH95929.1 aminodeoxychorismate synthase component I [Limnobaculum zhutongyuii]TQS89362.1 aminodeoxychorismate synthase component I [Limnobaculum zhutongyuii]